MSVMAARGKDVVLGFDGRRGLGPSDFSIPAGVLTAVIGPNGSGKSTLLSGLAGLLAPLSGELEVLGGPPAAARGRVAYVLQSPTVNTRMPITAAEVVAMGRYHHTGPLGRRSRTDRQAVAAAIEQLQLTRVSGLHLGELSVGQRQLVFVAQGLAQQAELLLLDEPATGIDLPTRQAIWDAVGSEIARGATVVITTHELTEAGTANHVLLLAGRVVAEGPPSVALAPHHLASAYGDTFLRHPGAAVVIGDIHHPTIT